MFLAGVFAMLGAAVFGVRRVVGMGGVFARMFLVAASSWACRRGLPR